MILMEYSFGLRGLKGLSAGMYDGGEYINRNSSNNGEWWQSLLFCLGLILGIIFCACCETCCETCCEEDSERSNQRLENNDDGRQIDRSKGEERVRSVAFDASTKQSSAPSLETEKTPVGDPIHVILLLMDPKTRRFELLQLEFDSSVAKVSDIYEQINASATEITLMSQEYDSLTNLKSEKLDDSKLISAYIDSSGIIIAVPTSSKRVQKLLPS